MTAEPVRFDTKIAVLLRDDLAPWQELNVTSFLVSGVVATDAELIGEPYEDADGTRYLAMLRQPVVVLAGDAAMLATAHSRALSRKLETAVYISEMFATGHDTANRAAVRAVARDSLDLVGIAVIGPRNAVDRTFKGAALHR
ncbi:DUF2000 family protein [Pseudolysinimonas sp.]|jgi:hypothetical protein|uniref:DUF2000 family protein n=1 Tax=Pseudolysinimonas sp. TaxID=2680009 RepID=UPI003784DFD2